MKACAVALSTLLLAACASTPVTHHAEFQLKSELFRDDLFAAPSVRIDGDDVFALNSDMRRYLNHEIAERSRVKGPQQGLIDALYDRNQLKLDYDAEVTRNAAQTFAARAGNCLSLVIMTAAFAKAMDLPVRYQVVLVDDAWSRAGGMYFSSSHVNLTLRANEIGDHVLDYQSAPMTVDFLDQRDIRGRRLRVIEEATIVAMYMNNRAAESLAQGQLANAYWWARAAIEHDPRFLSSYNTLAVIYRHHGNLQLADLVLSHVLELEPGNTQVMSNLALVYSDEGRLEESKALTRRLEQLQPYPPFYFFNIGVTAMGKGDYRTAKEMFGKEVQRDAYYHEFHFWLAAACLRLGEVSEARTQLALALENSSTRTQHALYAAKLDRINSYKHE